jgi:hypothetical protein
MASASRSARPVEVALLLGAALLGVGCGESKPPNACAGADLNTDPSNCGTCGFVCITGATCQAGKCVCPVGRSQCGLACVDLNSNAQNCGACGHACGLGTCGSATPGTCTCAAPAESCGASASPECVDKSTDVRNCGSCGHACLLNGTCTIGVCGCPPAVPNQCPTANPTACVDVQTDPRNCGVCGTACATSGICTSGLCGCPPNLPDLCGAACVDKKNDLKNCGSCNTVCTTGQGCTNGACTPTCTTQVCGANCCEGNGCCSSGTTCQTKHNNGISQNYFGCSPTGTVGNETTYTQAMARAAADAWNASVAPQDVFCGGAVCVGRQTATQCAVWCWAQPQLAGFGTLASSTFCFCPFQGGSLFSWN